MHLTPLLALFVSAAISAQSILIQQPTPGAMVQGTVTIAGTSAGLPNGTVSISIDGGAFQPAQGVANWSFAWDTTTVADGMHVIRARLRAFGTLPVFDLAAVDVRNTNVPAVAITSPTNGATVPGRLVVAGTSAQAAAVELSVDGGPFAAVQGLARWSVSFAPGDLAPGPHTLTARAMGGTQTVATTIALSIGTPPAGTATAAYRSSVDGEVLTTQLRIPPGFDPTVRRPLLVFLHGAGGSGTAMTMNQPLLAEIDARGWLAVAPDGRLWGLSGLGCDWQYSPAYVDSTDPNVGPGQQDILDAIDHFAAAYGTDPERVYLSGFSYGGRGAYIIGLKQPDRFAAIAPLGPPIDMYEVWYRRPENTVCKEGIAGGPPGGSPRIDTMYSITSARFLIENAYNLPVFHGHGLLDTVACNTTTESPFLHGFHITTNTAWNACHDAPRLCFGHTPTLSELAARHPDGYPWAYSFTAVGHVTDPFWFTGGLPPAGALGTPDPQQPGRLVGMFDFLARHTRVHAPDTVVYKTYTDTHRDAYWLSLQSATPWLDTPAAVRAHRDAAANTLTLELVRAASLEIDVGRAGLLLAPGLPLAITLAPLVEPAYDPALLAGPGELQQPTLVLRGDFSACDWIAVTRDGVPLDPALVTFVSGEIRLGPLPIAAGPASTIAVTGSSAFVDLGFGLAGTTGVPVLDGAGTTAPGGAVTFTITGALPNSAGLLGLGASTIYSPLLGGTLVPLPDVILPFALDAAGAAAVPSVWPALAPGTMRYLQAVVLDPAAPEWFAWTNGLQVTARP
ncbi:MAG: Ig-like domain-containing protein [Planctomycetes bacterium]|jgi:pimeloyl-ACP methyl ester carboxylesterase|nr:Ig-like domain-containing protein [Planctomycetota bacterium]